MFRPSLLLVIVASLFSCGNSDETPTTQQGTVGSSVENEFRALVKKYPDSVALRSKLVDYFAENGNYENALAETNVMLQKDSNNAELWDVKARLHFLDGDTLSAVKAYEKAIGIYPNPEYVISLGTLYAQTKNPLALTMADALLQAPLANAELQEQFIKGLYYTYMGEKGRAILYFDRCISLDYNFMDAYREKAIALYDDGKYETALKVLDQATTVKKTYDEAWYWKGQCYQRL